MPSPRSLPLLPSGLDPDHVQPYGDLVRLNTSREVLDAVGKEVLDALATEHLELLGTSTAVYEINGDYALGIVSSGWCRFMDAASHRLCGTDDLQEAVANGSWHCHTSCWNVSRESIQRASEVDAACDGGIRLYAVPIVAGDEVVGSINFGYGDPGRDPERLAELAQRYGVAVEELRERAEGYAPPSPEAVEMAKRRLRASAALIGEIVARKRAEETLRESERRFRFLADAVPQQIWVTRPDGYHEYYNRRWYDYTGLTHDETKGDGWNAVLHPDDRERAWARWRHSLATGEPYEIDYRFRRHDGQHRWFLGQALPERNDAGEIVRWVGTLTDVHERHEAAAERECLLNAVLVSEERNKLVSRATNDVIRDWDIGTGELAWSEGLERTFGYSPGSVPPRIDFWYDQLHPEDRDRVMNGIHAAIEGGESSWTAEYRFARADGGHAMVLDRGFIAHDATGQPTRMIGSMLDISERQQLLASERAARADAEAANKAKSDFLAAMSHELRTPLNAIGGYVDLLDMGVHGPIAQAQRVALDRVRANQSHLLTLINDVLAFAKLEAGHIEFDLRSLDVAALLASVEPLVAPQAAANGIALSTQECEPSMRMRGDEERVRQILLNLVSNAIKFTQEGGWVALSCEMDEEWTYVRVRDNGPGIEEDEQRRLFDPFVQVGRRLDRPQEGVGLGLAISRDLARGMGGDLRVESAPGEGSTFTVVLRRG